MNSLNDLKIVSWNILAPELFMYFWRSSYGLAVIGDKKYYDNVNFNRIQNVVARLRSYDADIICLQEVTNNTYTYLNNLSIQQYIADTLNYSVVSQSFKQSKFKYGYPPNEQFLKYEVDSGVATLVKNNSNVKPIQRIIVAENFGASPLFKSGIGSPFTLDQFYLGQILFNVLNVHIRMQYPHISAPVNEVYTRISSVLNHLQLQNTIALGDFNAHSLIAGRELFTSNFYDTMYDQQGSDLIDDHVFIGNSLRKYQTIVQYDTSLQLLETNINTPASDPNIWKRADVKYTLSRHNNDLIYSSNVTSDHYPILVTLLLNRRRNITHNLI